MIDLDLSAPLVAPDVDVRDLDGFMLNVERLMASELIALSSHEVIAAALFLWCRAWKQMPAASLPDDERVIAAFARLPLQKFRKMRSEVLRGFVKCSDGRLYHRVLAAEAMAAFDRKSAFRNRREKDNERLRLWRLKQAQNGDGGHFETTDETFDETRFEREGQGQGQGQGGDRDLKKKDADPALRDGPSEVQIRPDHSAPATVSTPEADLFRRGREILGSSAGGFVKKLLASKNGNIAMARSAIEAASQKADPREYLGGVINADKTSNRDMGGIRSSRDM